MQPNEIARRFTAHNVNQDQAARIEKVRAIYLQAGREIAALTPEGRDESLAFTLLEESSFYAVASIAREPV